MDDHKDRRFERLCFRALAEGVIGESRAAELLGISVRELDKRLDQVAVWPVPVLVFDISVLIDLERANPLEQMFLLPFEFAVPDLRYGRESAGELGDRPMQLGSRIEELTPVELRRATAVNRRHSRLSVPDTLAFAHRLPSCDLADQICPAPGRTERRPRPLVTKARSIHCDHLADR